MTDALTPTDHAATVNGLSLHYVEYPAPSPEAPTVILIHGITSTAGAMGRIAEHLASEYRVIGLDQRGHGESDWARTDGYDTDSFLSDLEGFVAHLGLSRFILIGQSMGGHHTIGYTARHPEQIICAVANDIPPAINFRNPEDYPDADHETLATIEEWIAPRRETNPFTPEWGHELAARTQLREVPGGWQPKHDPRVMRYWQPLDLWEEARTIERPLLLIRGGQSEVITAQQLQDMDMQIPGARSVTLEKAGHSTYYDMEPEWFAVVDAFLAAHRDG